MQTEIQARLSKIYELVKRGATEAEKNAAKKAFDKMVKKYDIDADTIEALKGDEKKAYRFKYSCQMEVWLFCRLLDTMIEKIDHSDVYKDTWHKKEIDVSLTYLEWVTMDASYGYFRKHMMTQFRKICSADIKRKRKVKTKNERRAELQDLFYSQYIIKSKLIDEKYLRAVNFDKLSDKEIEDHIRMGAVEGGNYNRQINRGLLLEI